MSVSLTEINFNSSDEIRAVARLYISVPKDWDSQYTVTEDSVDHYQQWLSENRDSLKCYLLKENQNIKGLHILVFQSDSSVCTIKTLWIEPSLRGQGWGTRLKEAGESWARSLGAHKLVTFVFAANTKMLQINKNYGFHPVRIEMHKELT